MYSKHIIYSNDRENNTEITIKWHGEKTIQPNNYENWVYEVIK